MTTKHPYPEWEKLNQRCDTWREAWVKRQAEIGNTMGIYSKPSSNLKEDGLERHLNKLGYAP